MWDWLLHRYDDDVGRGRSAEGKTLKQRGPILVGEDSEMLFQSANKGRLLLYCEQKREKNSMISAINEAVRFSDSLENNLQKQL
ncbi:hypothetical protein Y032_0001g120 [Ancylostoma ceylanicum]|uniref:Uncharacterized protein n=1 Tax=Ancylostoma ceylanicum TaxID=53326 RepID=A0A016W4B3_9BILA|nr:hypothetical protein Y032_0001g120 [Ancylostoma ceylanicum]